MSHSNATRCDWLRARSLTTRQRRDGYFTILEKRLRCASLSGESALFITWYSFNSSEDGTRNSIFILLNFALALTA